MDSTRIVLIAPSLAVRFGSDLTALVASLGTAVVDAVRITGLPARALRRATFRLTLADGRVLKARRLDAIGDAVRIRSIVERLGRPELPRVLAQQGAALLEEWMVGEPLGRSVPDLAFVERCGRILGTIHATSVDASLKGEASGDRARIERTVGELLRLGVVSQDVASDIHAVVQAHLPTEVATGFVHRDFCAQNIVRGPGGDPFIVDSGNVGVDAYDFDLARTWYRWRLPLAQRRAFEAGYRAHRGLETYTAQFPFWALAALTDSTLFRARARTKNWRVPLRRLEGLLKDLRGADRPGRQLT